MSTIWMKCHLPVKISMRYMLDEADYDAEKNKSKGCQGCWQQVKVDKSVHCVWSLNSQVLCAFGNVYFYNSLSQVGAKRWMFTVWLFTIKKIAVTAVTKEKQHSKQNTNKSQSYEVWDDKELFKSKKDCLGQIHLTQKCRYRVTPVGGKTFSQQIFPTELVMSAWIQIFSDTNNFHWLRKWWVSAYFEKRIPLSRQCSLV